MLPSLRLAIYCALGALLFAIALLTDRPQLLRWAVWAWIAGGMVFLLFGAMNFYTHIGMYHNIAYGTSYNPSAEFGTLTNSSVASLAPEKNFSVEAGAKVDLFDRRLSLTAPRRSALADRAIETGTAP